MPTPRFRSLVSIAAALTVTLTLGACASAPARLADARAADVAGPSATLRFDNGAREHVHVYLVGEQREWLLGRVEPGARATLRIPDDALAGNTASMRLAVVPGGRVSLRAAGERNASFTMVQPAGEILTQRWTFSQPLATGVINSVRLGKGSGWGAGSGE